MSDLPHLYGFDLITDAANDANREARTGMVDPFATRIRAVGISTGSDRELFTGSETEIIRAVDQRLDELAGGVLVTWNGSLLDLPLIAVRAELAELSVGLLLEADRRSAPVSPITGLDHACQAMWHGHQHLDLRRVYQAPSRWRMPRRRQIDHESMIPPPNDLVDRDPSKDAGLARRLCERRWPQARKHLDQLHLDRESIDLVAQLRLAAEESAPILT